MTYSAPTGDAVDFALTTGYTAPSGDVVDYELGDNDDPIGATPSPLPALIVRSGLRYQIRRDRLDRGISIPYIAPSARDWGATTPWRRGNSQSVCLSSHWSELSHLDRRCTASWILAAAHNARSGCIWRQVPHKDRGAVTPWAHGIAQDNGDSQHWRHLVKPNRRGQGHDLGPALPFRSSDIFRAKGGNNLVLYSVPAPGEPVNFSLTATDYTPPAAGDPVEFHLSIYETVLQDLPISPKDRGHNAPYRQLATCRRRDQARDPDTQILWGPGGSGWYRDSPPVITPWPVDPDPVTGPEPPLILESYKLMASIDVVRLPERTPVLVNEISIQTDTSAFCWQFSFSPARQEDLALVAPSGATPTEVEITINGFVWTGVCEGYSVDKRHGSSGYSVTGRSTTVLLASPYATPRTYSQSAARTASQLIDEELTNSGYISTYNGVDWLIPGDVWSYANLTPIAAIQRIAEASGARVVSEMASKAIRIERRHPHNPWDWDTAIADVALDESIITTWGGRWNPSPQYNACYVVGGEQGVIVQATRTGTAGDKQSPQIVEALCTAVECGRERGRTVLCESGNWESITATLPLLSGAGLPGLILPGSLVEINQGGETFKALAGSVRITGSRSSSTSIKQRITLERYRGS